MDQAEAGLAESKVKVGELRLKVEKSERDEKGRIEEAANLARRVHPERVLNGVLLMNGPDVYIARAPIPTVLLIKTMCRMRVCEVCMCETQPSCVVRLYVREHAWDISPFCCFVETRRPGLSCRLQFHHVRLPHTMLKAHLANIRSTSGLPRLDPFSLDRAFFEASTTRKVFWR